MAANVNEQAAPGELPVDPVGGEERGDALPALAVLGACLAWAMDNNFTRKVALADATYIAMIKGLAAGITNVAVALAAGAAAGGLTGG